MKALILIILGIICSYTVYSQQNQVKNTVTMSLPKGSEKVVKSSVNSKMSKNSIFSQKIAKDLDAYNVGGYPVLINAGDAKVTAAYLKDLKTYLDESAVNAKYNYYNSVLKRYSNFEVLIINRESKSDTIGFIHFYCVNKTNERCFNGQLEYPHG